MGKGARCLDEGLQKELEKELEELREENKILRDSLVEIREEESDGEGEAKEGIAQEIADMFGASIDQMKAFLAPGAEQLTAQLSRQLDENPAALLLAAFGAGYLLSRGIDRK